MRRSLSGLRVGQGAAWWLESRPEQSGRQVVLRALLSSSSAMQPTAGDGLGEDASPPDASVRSRVHEYGGGAFAICAEGLAYVEQGSQAAWMLTHDGSRVRLTPEPAPGEQHRYGDLWPVPGAAWLLGVRERHEPEHVTNELVAISLAAPRGGSAPGSAGEGDSPDPSGPGAQAEAASGQWVVTLARGHDFYSAGRASPDGKRVAFMCWDHPSMPWDSSELWVADLSYVAAGKDGTCAPVLEHQHLVAGGEQVAVGQPTWGPDGSLWFVSDERGWWQPYRYRPDDPDGPVARASGLEVDFHEPDWSLGQQTMAALDETRLACRWHDIQGDHVGILDSITGEVAEVPQPCRSVRGVASDSDTLVILGTPVDSPQCVLAIDLADGSERALSAPAAPVLDPAWLPRPRSMPGTGNVVVYLPTAPGFTGLPDELPPLLLLCHGGPTSHAEIAFDPSVAFFTSRGFAVATVDYRGSSGYGRAYRKMLDGLWGIADVEDVIAAAEALGASGLVDGRRMVVKGSSAGGFTALEAMAASTVFAGGVVAYGVTDLAALGRDTHKFESHYLDTLVGPWPQCQGRYLERSPAYHPERIGAPVLVLQGAEDPVVLPSQAAAIAEALRERGVECEHLVFAGEGHGFRRAETIEAAAKAELDFLTRILKLR